MIARHGEAAARCVETLGKCRELVRTTPVVARAPAMRNRFVVVVGLRWYGKFAWLRVYKVFDTRV